MKSTINVEFKNFIKMYSSLQFSKSIHTTEFINETILHNDKSTNPVVWILI